jgi:acetyl esterase/lipase
MVMCATTRNHPRLATVALAGLAFGVAYGAFSSPLTPEELFRAVLVYKAPGLESVKVTRDLVYRQAGTMTLRADVYTPAPPAAALPVVLFVHGGFPEGLDISPKESGQYTSWGRSVAASGMAAVTFNHRLRMSQEGAVHLQEAAGDLTSVIAWIHATGPRYGLDPRRIAVFAVSAGGPLLTVPLADPGLRCLVAYYAFLDVHELRWFANAVQASAGSNWSMVDALDRTRLPPILVARAGRDAVPQMKDTIDRFVARALARDAELTLLNHATGQHAFDVQDDDPRSREIIAATLQFLREHLL